MDRLTAAIPVGATVAIDSVTFIYQIERAPRYQDIVRPFFAALARGEFQAVTSVVSLMEIVVRPLQLQRPDIADEYELLLLNYPNLTIVEVNRSIARYAAELRAAERLRPADALQLGTALESGATIFVTNDRALAGLSQIDVLILDTLL